MKDHMFAIIIALIVFFVLCGCSRRSKQVVHVPSRWTTMEYVKEMKAVWFIKNDEIDIDNTEQRRKIIEVIWTADMNGKTIEQIQEAFKTRKLTDVLTNGV